MPFTDDRASWTAAQLNAVWKGIIEFLAPELPFRIRVNSTTGDQIDNLDINESDVEAFAVSDPYSTADAFVQRASDRFLGSWSSFYDVEESKYKIEVRETLPISQNQDVVVLQDYFTPVLIAFVYLQISGSTFSFNGDKIITNTSDGWSDENEVMVEDFEGEGFNDWDVGFALSGIIEEFNDDEEQGIDKFDVGEGYLSGEIETFTEGDWPTGVVPPSGGSSDYRTFDASDQIDGEKTIFNVPDYDTELNVNLRVYYNGQRLTTGTDVTMLTSTTFSLTFAPVSGTELVVDYKPQ